MQAYNVPLEGRVPARAQSTEFEPVSLSTAQTLVYSIEPLRDPTNPGVVQTSHRTGFTHQAPSHPGQDSTVPQQTTRSSATTSGAHPPQFAGAWPGPALPGNFVGTMPQQPQVQTSNRYPQNEFGGRAQARAGIAPRQSTQGWHGTYANRHPVVNGIQSPAAATVGNGIPDTSLADNYQVSAQFGYFPPQNTTGVLEVVRKLYKATTDEIFEDDSEAICPICLEQCEAGSTIRTECGHVFHAACAQQSEQISVRQHYHWACPTCRECLTYISSQGISMASLHGSNNTQNPGSLSTPFWPGAIPANQNGQGHAGTPQLAHDNTHNPVHPYMTAGSAHNANSGPSNSTQGQGQAEPPQQPEVGAPCQPRGLFPVLSSHPDHPSRDDFVKLFKKSSALNHALQALWGQATWFVGIAGEGQEVRSPFVMQLLVSVEEVEAEMKRQLDILEQHRRSVAYFHALYHRNRAIQRCFGLALILFFMLTFLIYNFAANALNRDRRN